MELQLITTLLTNPVEYCHKSVWVRDQQVKWKPFNCYGDINVAVQFFLLNQLLLRSFLNFKF